MNYKLFAILALCITCLFSSGAYASALPKDDTPDGEIGDPNRIPKNPSTTPPGTVPPPAPQGPDATPKPSKWDKVKKNIKKIGKPSLPDVAIWILGEGIDKVMDPKNNTAIKCDGTWMYHSVQGGRPTESGSYVEHAQTVFYDYVTNQTRKNMGRNPFIEPNFRDGGKGYDRSDGNPERFVEYDTYDWWGRKTSGKFQVYKFCQAPDPKTDEPPSETEAPEGPDATPPQPNPDPNADPNTTPKPNPNPDKEPNPRPEPEKDPNAKPEKPEPGKDGKDGKDGQDAKPFELPAFCDWAGKVCEWIDWTKKPLDDDNTQIDVPDPSKESINTDIHANGSCPNDVVIQGSFAGQQFEFFRFEWSKFCAWLAILKPIIIAMASYGAVKIVGGVNVAD